MKSLVTGATGFLGRALVERLVREDGPESVTGLVREPLPEAEREARDALVALGVRLLPMDLLALPVGRLSGIDFDVLYHLAAETDSQASPERLEVNDRGTAHLLETLGREQLHGRRVVLAGASAAVDRARRPRGLMKESDPPAPRTAYGESKLRAERVLAGFAEAWGFDFVVPRLSPVWRPALDTGFLDAFRKQAEGRSILRRVGWPGRITMVALPDAAAILAHLGKTGAADGRAVHVGDGRVYGYRKLLRDIRRRSGDRGWFFPVPRLLWALVRFTAWLPVLRGFVPWRLSCLLGDDLAVDTTVLRSVYPHALTTWEDDPA